MLNNYQKADILDRILELLKEDMDLEQVCYCKHCYFWGTSGQQLEGSPVHNSLMRHCRKYGQDKLWNDHCSDGIRPSRRKEE